MIAAFTIVNFSHIPVFRRTTRKHDQKNEIGNMGFSSSVNGCPTKWMIFKKWYLGWAYHEMLPILFLTHLILLPQVNIMVAEECKAAQ